MGEEPSGAVVDGPAALVMQALRDTASVAEDLIRVREFGGAVHLTGHIGSHQAKRDVERVAAQVPGVRHVVNELRVASPMFPSDEQVAAAISAAFAAEPLLRALLPVVEARGGIIFLRGEVGSLRARCVAEECAWSVQGVRDVHNGLTIQQGHIARKDSLAWDIGRQLVNSLGLEGRLIEVDLREGIAYLQGTVPTEEHRWRAADAVGWERRLLGIVNQLEIPGEPVWTDLPTAMTALPPEQNAPPYLSPSGPFAGDLS